MKCFALILLSFSLFHAGIARAFQDCSLELDHSKHHHLGTEKSNHSRTPTGATATIHCAKFSHETGPVVQISRLRIHRPFSDGVSLKTDHYGNTASLLSVTKIHPLKFPYIGFNPALYSTKHSLYLFLTVFRI